MLAVILNQRLIKKEEAGGIQKTANSFPPNYETRNIVSSADGVSCAEKDDFYNFTNNCCGISC